MTNASRTKRRAAMFTPAIAFLAAICGMLLPATLWATTAAASTQITEPSGGTYHVVLDPSGRALPVTVVASGFRPGSQVFLEECDGRAPSEPNWSPTLDCDNGNAPAPAIADQHGTATFSKDDRNRTFVPIVGASPSNLFNCNQPNTTPPANELTNYTTCQFRVSSNNVQATEDQVFHSVVIGSAGSDSGSKAPVIAGAVLVLLVIGGVVGTVLWLRRRRPAAVSRK